MMRLAGEGSSRSKKSRRIHFTKTRDCVSNLPQTIVAQILSRLPTKEAVRTCVLSKTWRYKWTSIYNVGIQDRRAAQKGAFVNFVCRVLVLANSIKNFRLSCLEEYDLSCMTGWISTALKHELESFIVNYTKPGITLPCTLLHCLSLKKLELVLPCTFRVSSPICFPNLQTLRLEGVEVLNELYVDEPLVFSFPVLETFELIHCKWLNATFVEINAPALMTFKTKTPYDSECNDYTIKLVAPKVANFKLHGGVPENFVFTGSQVVFAYIKWTGYDLMNSGSRVRQLLKEFSSLEELKIAGELLLEAAIFRERVLFDALPQYDNLRRLVVFYCIAPKALLLFLHKAPSLKFLSMDVATWHDIVDHETFETVPVCLVSHLEEVRVSNFKGSTPQLHLVEFLLKNGRQLKKLFLSVSDEHEVHTDELVEHLASCPKASTCLVIAVN